MKNKIFTIVSIFLLIGVFVSCSKDESTGGTSDHPTVALLKKVEWKITSQTLNGSDVFSSKDACERDDSYIFQSDSVCMRNENTIKCNPSNPGPFMSEWYFNEDYTDLTFDNMDYILLELTETKLQVQEKSGTGAVFISTLEPK
jgi:hypothetical protein